MISSWINKHINSLYNCVFYITCEDLNKANYKVKQYITQHYNLMDAEDDQQQKYYIIDDFQNIDINNVDAEEESEENEINNEIIEWINNNAIVDSDKHIKYILNETINRINNNEFKREVLELLKTSWRQSKHLTPARTRRGYYIYVIDNK